MPKLNPISISNNKHGLLILLSVASLVGVFGLFLFISFFYSPKQVKGSPGETTVTISSDKALDWVRVARRRSGDPCGTTPEYSAYKGTSLINRYCQQKSLIKFNISDIPPGKNITKATFYFYTEGSDSGTTISLNHITNDSWSSSASSPDSLWNWPIENQISSWPSGTSGWRSIDITPDLKQDYNLDKTLSLKWEYSGGANQVERYTSPTGTNKPYIEVAYSSPLKCDGGSSREIFPQDKWYTCYYQGQINPANFIGSDTNTTSQFLDLNWGTGVIYGGLPDNISASFRRLIDFAPGYYKFTVASDDAADLLVGSYDIYRTQTDLYQSSGYNSYTSGLIYLEGKKPVRVLWHDNAGSAQLRVSWQKVEVQEKAIVGIDTDTSGNTATSLGPTNSCVSLSSGQTTNVDLFIKDINLISSQGVSLEYDRSLIEVTSINPNMLLTANSGSSPANFSEIHNDQGYSLVALVDQNTAAYQSVETGSGVLARITLKAKGSGLTLLKITPKDLNQDKIIDYGPGFNNAGGYKIGDTNKDGIFDGPVLNAVIAINRPCSADMDNDGFTNDVELYIGTDPLDACPDDSSDSVWPPDINNDKTVDTLDILMYKNQLGGNNPRYDLNTDGSVNVFDILLYKQYLGKSCSNL